MEQKTLEAVREAELAAAETERNAAKRRDAILDQAGRDAAKLTADAISEARTQAAAVLEAARAEGERMQREAEQSVQQEVEALRASVNARRDEARRLVLAQLL